MRKTKSETVIKLVVTDKQLEEIVAEQVAIQFKTKDEEIRSAGEEFTEAKIEKFRRTIETYLDGYAKVQADKTVTRKVEALEDKDIIKTIKKELPLLCNDAFKASQKKTISAEVREELKDSLDEMDKMDKRLDKTDLRLRASIERWAVLSMMPIANEEPEFFEAVMELYGQPDKYWMRHKDRPLQEWVERFREKAEEIKERKRNHGHGRTGSTIDFDKGK